MCGSLFLAIALVRLLEAREYGAYMAVWGLAVILTPLTSLGLVEAVKRFLPEILERGNAAEVRRFVILAILVRGLLVVGVLGGLSFFWTDLATWLDFDTKLAAQARAGFVLIFLYIGYNFICSFLDSMLEQEWSHSIHALFQIGRLAGVAILWTLGEASIERVFLVDVVVGLICLGLAVCVLAIKLRLVNGKGHYRIDVREILSFSWHLAGVNLLSALTGSGAQRLLVARLLGLEAAGLFAFLQQIIRVVGRCMPTHLLANLITPMLVSRNARGQQKTVQDTFSLMWKGNLLVIAALLAPLAILGNWGIALLSGGRFDQAGLAALMLLLWLAANSQQRIISLSMQINDRTRALRLHSLLLLLTPVFAVLGSALGLIGLILGVAAASWVRNVYGYYWMARAGLSIQIDRSATFRCMGVAILTAVLIIIVNLWMGPLPALLIAAPAMILGFLLSKPFNRDDFELIARILGPKSRHLGFMVRE